MHLIFPPHCVILTQIWILLEIISELAYRWLMWVISRTKWMCALSTTLVTGICGQTTGPSRLTTELHISTPFQSGLKELERSLSLKGDFNLYVITFDWQCEIGFQEFQCVVKRKRIVYIFKLLGELNMVIYANHGDTSHSQCDFFFYFQDSETILRIWV